MLFTGVLTGAQVLVLPGRREMGRKGDSERAARIPRLQMRSGLLGARVPRS